MTLVKLIKIAFLLKDINLIECFTKDGCNVELLVSKLSESVVEQIAEIATGEKSSSKLDAEAGIVAFFLQLIGQMKTSKQAKILVECLINGNLLPIKLAEDQKKAVLDFFGKI